SRRISADGFRVAAAVARVPRQRRRSRGQDRSVLTGLLFDAVAHHGRPHVRQRPAGAQSDLVAERSLAGALRLLARPVPPESDGCRRQHQRQRLGDAVQRQNRQSEPATVPHQRVRSVVRVVSGPGHAGRGAPFRKDILRSVVSQVTNTVFDGNPFGVPNSLAIAACGSTPGCSPSATWAFSAPVNTPGGELNGVEFNYQQPLRFLPGLLSNLGVLMNYTYVSSSVRYATSATTFVSNELLGLSKDTAGMTVYYEDPKWSIRVSGAYRSRYLTQVPGQEVGTSADGWNSTFNLDASLQYNVTSHFRVSLEGVNLTDQFESQFNDTSRNLVTYYHHTGRQVLLGVRYQY